VLGFLSFPRIEFAKRMPVAYRMKPDGTRISLREFLIEQGEMVKRLLAAGVRFHPDQSDELQFLRRCLRRLDWSDGYDLLKCIHEAGALDQGHVVKLLKHPRLSAHFEKRLPALSRMFSALEKLIKRKATAAALG
jgi:hypothetical protein